MYENSSSDHELIYNSLSDAFGNDAEQLMIFCYHGLNQPLGIDHPLIIQNLVGGSLSKSDFENVKVGYVLITAYYFLLDAVVDEHLKNKLHPLYLTHLLALSCQKFGEILYSKKIKNPENFNRAFYRLISENALAIRLENEFSLNPLYYSEKEEYESITGRSNSSIMLLELISFLTGKNEISNIKKILQEFAFYVQLGDDLADWREDYNTKKYTSFLREIFSKHGRILNEEHLEEEIYLTGIFEARALKVINGLENVLISLNDPNIGGKHLTELIEFQIKKVKALLAQIITIKLNEQ